MPNLNEIVDIEKNGDHAECPRCHSVITVKLTKNLNDDMEGRSSVLSSRNSSKCQRSRSQSRQVESALSILTESEPRKASPLKRSQSQKYLKNGKLYRSADLNAEKEDVDWNELNLKIEDWFQGAKTPGNNLFYTFNLRI